MCSFDSAFCFPVGFRSDQLRVQVNSLGTVLVTGERRLEDNTWSRFRQEFKPTGEYCLNSIRARIRNGVLHIIVPRKEVNHPRPAPQQPVTVKSKTDRNENHGMAGIDPRFGDPNVGETGSERLRLKGSCRRLQFIDRRRVLQVSAAVLAAAVIGVGTYLASKYLFNHGDRMNPNQLIMVPTNRP